MVETGERIQPDTTISVVARFSVLEDLFKGNPKHFSDQKSDFERGRVLSQFNGIDSLTRNADAIGEGLLSHFAVLLAQLPNVIGDPAAHVRARA
jgi:hypothetical protein